MVVRIKLNAAPAAPIYLAEWRETKFATQRELAEAMNTTSATVSRIETGEREWSKGYLEALAYLVGCQVADLFQPPDTVRNSPKQGMPELSELMRLAGKLEPEQIEGLIALLGKNTVSAPPG
ncbi:MAG: helix-turn-helix domain-containing protein [Reyranellaceae bacterium]